MATSLEPMIPFCSQRIQILGAYFHAPDPSSRMDIAQASLAVFHVGLQEINRSSIALVPQAILLEFFLDESMHSPLDQPVFHRLAKLLIEVVITAEVARVQQRGFHFHVDGRQTDGFFHGAGGVTYLESSVPQGVEQLLGHGLDVGRYFP